MAESPKIDADSCAERLKAVADGERLRIVCLLRDGPKTVGDIAANLDELVVNVSHHLQVLKRANLVNTEKDGRRVFYRLAEDVVSKNKAELDFGCCQLKLNRDNIS